MSLGHGTVPITTTLGWPDPAAAGRGGRAQRISTHSKAIAQPLGLGLGRSTLVLKFFSVSDSFLFCSLPSSQALGCPSSQSQHRDPGCVQGHPDEAKGLRSPRVFPGRFLKLTRSQYICLLFGESSCWRGPSLCPVIANPLTRMSKKTGDSDRDLGHGVGVGGEKREAVFSLYVLLQLFLTMYMHLLLKNEK